MQKNEVLMKTGIKMRVLFCKIQCPLICFCKQSAAHHLYTPSPLKLDNAPRVVVPSTTEDFAGPNVSETSSSDEGVNVNGNGKQEAGNTLPKSCLRKFPYEPDSTKEDVKKCVKWVDASGQELAEIKEFESRGYRH